MSHEPVAADHVLDHVAIRVADRDAVAAELTEHFDLRVIERTDRFTLVGPDFEHGKITLLDADEEDERAPVARRIVSLVLAERPDASSTAPRVLENGLVVTLRTDATGAPRHALVGVSLRSDDPPIAAAHLERTHGMRVESVRPDVAVLRVGPGADAGRITLSRERWTGADGPSMLDHLGIRVDDAAGWRDQVQGADVEIVRWVDAPHSLAVFVSGPEDLLLEFVEHTAPIEA